jgi:soluble lytic murein transglycosylase
MTIRTCLAKTIPALWFSLLALAALSAASGPPAKRAPAKAKPATQLAAPPGLPTLVRAYREAPTTARRAAIEAYAAAHPKEAPLVHLALGVALYEARDYAGAIASLRKPQTKLEPVADYTAYYLAAARVEARDMDGIARDLRPVYTGEVASPFAGKAWLLQGRAARQSAPADAVRLLREHYAELPQPEGDIALADSYLASGDQPHAAELYQRVFAQYLSGDASARAAAALAALRESMGAAYPAPSPQLLLRHADRLMETRAFRQARTEYRSLAGQLGGLERDQARVRAGEADFQDTGVAAAYPYLRQLELPDSEADAERLYYVVECARRLSGDDEMQAAVDRLTRAYPRSPWRLKALLSAANRYLLVNRADEFVPLYKAVYQDFPAAPEAALAHWKVTFQAYLHDSPQAQDLLQEHLKTFPAHATAGGALYFLGRWFERTGDPGAARACYQRLTRTYENHYYSMLARQRNVAEGAAKYKIGEFLSGLVLPAAHSVPPEPNRPTTLRIDRSRLLRAAGLADLADSELRFGARNGGQPALLGMEMADAADAPHQAMHVMKAMVADYLNLPFAAAPRRFWELLFPLPYRTDLERTASEEGVDPFLLAGLIRQESEFDPQALSHAHAYGLTQVLPTTGRQYARQAGIQRFSSRLLFQPATNLKLGAAILRGMLDHNQGKVEPTLAAYNAGPNRPAEWLTWNQYREPAEFVESIPFTETRDYVQAVMRNADVYRRLYK